MHSAFRFHQVIIAASDLGKIYLCLPGVRTMLLHCTVSLGVWCWCIACVHTWVWCPSLALQFVWSRWPTWSPGLNSSSGTVHWSHILILGLVAQVSVQIIPLKLLMMQTVVNGSFPEAVLVAKWHPKNVTFLPYYFSSRIVDLNLRTNQRWYST